MIGGLRWERVEDTRLDPDSTLQQSRRLAQARKPRLPPSRLHRLDRRLKALKCLAHPIVTNDWAVRTRISGLRRERADEIRPGSNSPNTSSSYFHQFDRPLRALTRLAHPIVTCRGSNSSSQGIFDRGSPPIRVGPRIGQGHHRGAQQQAGGHVPFTPPRTRTRRCLDTAVNRMVSTLIRRGFGSVVS
jgi:hypothetical protein